MATYTTLRKGSKGSEVTNLQKALINAGYDVGSTGADGSYGAKTQAAVLKYQKDNGLKVDGIAGSQTLGSLYASNTDNNSTENNSNSTINGLDRETEDRAYNNSFDASDDVKQQKDKADSLMGDFEELASQKEIIDQNTKDAMNQKFEVSDEYKQAMELTQGLLDQLMSGKTSYTDQINDLMSQIMNREDFEYDVDKDTLFQNALASAMNSGRSAMQDTIGQASALTGGYGSTYATSAGNQAYNAFIEDAYDNLPEYYQMALEAYQMEGQEMYNQLNMLNNADATEYQRMYNSWDASFRNAQDIWNKDFSTWDAGVNQAFNSANIQLSEHSQLVDNAYKLWSSNMDVYESMYAKEYQTWQDQVTQAQQYAQIRNTDYWNDKNYKQTEYWNQQEQNHKNDSLAEQKRQFNYSIGDTNNDGKVDENELAALNKGSISTDDIEVDENGNITSVKGYNIAGTSSATTPSVSEFKTGDGKNFEVSIGDTSYKVQNGGKVTRDTSIANLQDPSKIKVYGNLIVYEGSQIYIKNGNDYYRVEGRATSKSGYNDLLMALTK